MRIKENFASERKSEIETYKPKIFIASEGACSEPKYFEGLNKSIISENVAIINILRDFATKNNSHPSFTISILQEFILNVKDEQITLKEIKNKIANYDREHSCNLDLETINGMVDSIFPKTDEYKINRYEIGDILFQVFKPEIYKDLAKNFVDYFEAQNVTYSPEVDSLNMVVDRDKESFVSDQFDKVRQFCEEKNVNLYISNPCFEFWLMLHFPEVESENQQKMLENKKVNSSRRYLEQKLHAICKYKKKQFIFAKFEPNILDAIKREKAFAEDLDSLKDNLGTNVGVLVQNMINAGNE